MPWVSTQGTLSSRDGPCGAGSIADRISRGVSDHLPVASGRRRRPGRRSASRRRLVNMSQSRPASLSAGAIVSDPPVEQAVGAHRACRLHAPASARSGRRSFST